MDFTKREILYKEPACEIMRAALRLMPKFKPDDYYLHLYDGKDIGREDPTPWAELSPSQRQTRRRHYLNPELPKSADIRDEDHPSLIEQYRAVRTTPRQALWRLKKARDACIDTGSYDRFRNTRYCDLGTWQQQAFISSLSELYAATCDAYQVLSDAERVNQGVYRCSVFTPVARNVDGHVNANRTLNNYLALPIEERAAQNLALRKKSTAIADALWEAMPKLQQLLELCVNDKTCREPLPEGLVERLPPQLVAKLPPAGKYPVVLQNKELSETRAAIKPEGLPEDRYTLDDGKIKAHGLKGAERFEMLVEAKTALLYVMTLQEMVGERALKIPTRMLSDTLSDALGYMHWDYEQYNYQRVYMHKSPYLEAEPLRDTLQTFIAKEREALGTKRKGEHDREYFTRFEAEAKSQAPTLAPILADELNRHSRIHTLASNDEARRK